MLLVLLFLSSFKIQTLETTTFQEAKMMGRPQSNIGIQNISPCWITDLSPLFKVEWKCKWSCWDVWRDIPSIQQTFELLSPSNTCTFWSRCMWLGIWHECIWFGWMEKKKCYWHISLLAGEKHRPNAVEAWYLATWAFDLLWLDWTFKSKLACFRIWIHHCWSSIDREGSCITF